MSFTLPNPDALRAAIIPRPAIDPALADTLAYLARRQANAAAIGASSAADEETRTLARDRARQLQVLIDDLRAGLHVGAAEAEAMLNPPTGVDFIELEREA